MSHQTEYPYRGLPVEYRRVQCPICRDFGVAVESSTGIAYWCGCESGARLRELSPDLVERRNRFFGREAPPLPADARPITAADVERVLEERKKANHESNENQ